MHIRKARHEVCTCLNNIYSLAKTRPPGSTCLSCGHTIPRTNGGLAPASTFTHCARKARLPDSACFGLSVYFGEKARRVGRDYLYTPEPCKGGAIHDLHLPRSLVYRSRRRRHNRLVASTRLTWRDGLERHVRGLVAAISHILYNVSTTHYQYMHEPWIYWAGRCDLWLVLIYAWRARSTDLDTDSRITSSYCCQMKPT